MAKKKAGKVPTVVADVASTLAETAAGVAAAAGSAGKKGRAKDGGKSGRNKASRKKDKASRAEKRAEKLVESGVRELAKLATHARKRLAKLVKKLGPVSARRDALLDELTALQQGIAAGVERFGRDTTSNRTRG